jgi:SAM-dependent methyltransferase
MPFPDATLEEVYIDPDEYFRGHDVEAKKQNGLRLMSQFESRLGKRGRFLDVGCGAGEVLWAATQSGWEAEGVDPSSDFIEIGKQKLGVEGRVATLKSAAYPDKFFDAVALNGIIEHLYDPFDVLTEVNRVLRDDGWLYFDAPNEDGLYMKAGNLYMRLRNRDWVVVMAPTFAPYHVQGFNPRSLKALLARAGFCLDELQIVGGVCEQGGKTSISKKLEFFAAKIVNGFGRLLNMGSYMAVWATKDTNS